VTLQTALVQGQKLLEEAEVQVPRLTAEVLLAHAIGCKRSWLFAHSDEELQEVWWIHYGRYLHQRMQGIPTQYITGLQEFYGRDFRVTPAVLIPRPETEHLIETALRHRAAKILDIGTGSGAIAITLALETNAQVYATDIATLQIARQNAQSLNAHVNFVQCDLATFRHHSFDLIVANPPYIPERDKPTLQREVRDHEPAQALYGGEDGLTIYRRLIPKSASLLRPGGRLIIELGHDSLPEVLKMLTGWTEIEIIQDLAKIPRVLTALAPEV
jgi:release factor glutamine methyltransferase